MTDRQRVHVGMMNSYNVLTNKVKLIDVIESSIPIFAHIIDEVPNKNELELIISYFENIEEYEKCIELKCVVQSFFNDDGSLKKIHKCECDMPSFALEYSDNMVCSKCNNRILYERNY